MVARLFDRDRDVVQLHLGGGTPNFLARGDERPDAEPRTDTFISARAPTATSRSSWIRAACSAGDIATYAALGFTRASFGVQDFDPAVQQAINRVQSVEQTLQAIDDCRASAFVRSTST